MYIYNVTVNVDESILKEWLEWIHEHIPQVLATGRFVSARFTKVLVEEEMGGETFSIQYLAKTREDLDKYYQFDADLLRGDGLKFGNKMLAFRTELQLLDEFTVNEN